MRTHIISPSDLCYTSIRCHYHYRCLVTLQRSVQKWKTLYIQHMDLIYKQYTWHYLCSTLLSPLCHLLIYLLSHLWLYLPYIPCKQSQKPLCSTIYHIYLMQCHSVYYLLPLLQLSLWTLYKSSLWTHIVKVTTSRKRSTQLWYLPWRLIYCYNIPCHYLLLLYRLYHLLPQVIHCLHLCRLQCYLPTLWPRLQWLIYLYLHYLPLYYLCLLPYPNSYWLSKCLRQWLCLWHLQRIYLWPCQHCKWSFLSQWLCHTHRYCRLTSPWLSSYQHCSTCYLTLSYHVQNYTCCSSCFYLNNI